MAQRLFLTYWASNLCSEAVCLYSEAAADTETESTVLVGGH